MYSCIICTLIKSIQTSSKSYIIHKLTIMCNEFLSLFIITKNLMILLFLLYFSPIYDPNSLYLANGRKVKANKRNLLSVSEYSWYFANFPNFQYSFKNYENDYKSQIEPNNIINSNWCYLFLSYDEYLQVSQNEFIKLYEVQPQDKIGADINTSYDDIINNVTRSVSNDNQNYKKYIVKAHNSFYNQNSLSPYIKKITSLFDDFYEVESNNVMELANNQYVLSVDNTFDIQLQNRWVHAFLQNGVDSISFEEPGPRGKRTIPLNGSNVVVTIIDSGVDKDHLFFKDSQREFPFNRIDKDHRKIVRYVTLADDKDKISGHGTHCAGTIAGYAECNDCPINLYQGAAPMAKLQVIDFTADSEQALSPFSFQSVKESVANATEVNSHIISCSWGSETNLLFSSMVDDLMFKNDNVAMVFAAGNLGNFFSIMSPSDSKNVITVGATSSPSSTNVEFQRKYFILANGTKYYAKLAHAYSVMTSDTKRTYENLKIVKYTELNNNEKKIQSDSEVDNSSFENKIVVISSFSNVADCVQRKAQAILLVSEEQPTTAPRSTVFLYFNGNDNKLQEILNLEQASIRFEPLVSSSQYYSSSFSSKGPTLLGLMKPDLSAPGEHIFSASPANQSTIIERSGTSMATPSIAGCLALIEQYFTENMHGFNNIDINLTNYFLKAVLIQSTHSMPSVAYGHGFPRLDSTLVFPPYPNLGLRFFKAHINSSQDIKFNITTGKGQFRCTLCWNDYPTQNGTPLLFADLDLFIILENGTKIYGNMGTDTDALSTVEKIIANLEEDRMQNIEIHIVSNDYLTSNIQIPFAFVCNGNFPHTDTELNPITPNLEYSQAIDKCSHLTAGNDCQFKIQTLEYGKITSFENVKPRTFQYTSFPITSNLKKYITIKVSLKDNSDKSVIIRSIIRVNHSRKMNYPQAQAPYSLTNDAIFYLKTSSVNKYSNLYYAFLIDSQTQSNVEVKLDTTNQGHNAARKWGEFPNIVFPTGILRNLFISSAFIFFSVITYGIYTKIYEDRENADNNNNNTPNTNNITRTTRRVRTRRSDLADIEEPLQP